MKLNRLDDWLNGTSYRALALSAVVVVVVANQPSLALAGPVAFRFEAELVQNPGPFFPLPLGQRLNGQYTFELNTPPTPFPSPNSLTFYFGAVTRFVVTFSNLGTGVGSGGYIALGDPVRVSGSYDFLADYYEVDALVSGITITSPFGDLRLASATIQLKDLDQVGLATEELLPTPPSLVPFLDHTGPMFNADSAEIFFNFAIPNEPFTYTTIVFQLTELAVVPEPSGLVLALLGPIVLRDMRFPHRRR